MENSCHKCQKILNVEISGQVVTLPICVISNILSRLPAEVILEYRCVCKFWYALTSESSFIMKQLDLSKHHESTRYLVQGTRGDDTANVSLLDISNESITKMKVLPPAYVLSDYSIVCACNGLLCLRPKEKLDSIVVCNPMTRNYLSLPSTGPAKKYDFCKSYQLGFHFDNSSKKYKVIREFRLFNNKPSNFQLITIGEHLWKGLTPPYYEVEEGFGAAIFWNNGFHWKISERDCRMSKKCILGFNLTEEKFYTISFPQDYEEICYYPHTYKLVGLGDDLNIVEYDLSLFIRIWKVGNKVEGFSMLLQYTYVLSVSPTKMWQQEMISRIDKEMYLILVNAWNPRVDLCTIEIFSPTKQPHHRMLNIVGLPLHFKIINFKPSLVSPLSLEF